jgi:hypothetical protein
MPAHFGVRHIAGAGLAARALQGRGGGLLRRGLLWLCLGLVLLAVALPARSQGVELATLAATHEEGELRLEFAARVTLPRAAEDALLKGVPLYFVAEATLLRNRWYWRDQRVARVSRSWRVALQPLTGNWRVSLGGFNQNYPSLDEALLAISRSGGWKLAERAQLDADASYYVNFSFRLDSSQLPGPMQFGLGGGSDWAVGVTRSLRVEP